MFDKNPMGDSAEEILNEIKELMDQRMAGRMGPKAVKVEMMSDESPMEQPDPYAGNETSEEEALEGYKMGMEEDDMEKLKAMYKNMMG